VINKVYPPFLFVPKRLISKKDEVKKKYEKLEEEILKQLSIKRIPDLLIRIRQITFNRDVIIAFAEKLSKHEIKILAYAYPYHQENDETIGKIILILQTRYSPIIGRLMWQNLQQNPNDQHLLSFIRNILNNNKFIFSAFEQNHNRILINLFQSSNVSKAMAYYIFQNKLTFKEALKNWHIKLRSKWALLIDFYLLKMGLANEDFIRREGSREIREQLSRFPLSRYKQLIEVYLTMFEPNQYDYDLLDQVIEKLKDPNKNKESWREFSPEVVEKVKRWINLGKLKRFFANDTKYERFKFWVNYEKYFKNVEIIKEPPIAIMDFGTFIAIEFAETGNAVHFYEREGFMSEMYPKIKRKRSDSSKKMSRDIFKNKSAPYYLNAPHHRGYWAYTFDQYIKEYLNGNFNYDHKWGY
jgi:hypothetical protein